MIGGIAFYTCTGVIGIKIEDLVPRTAGFKNLYLEAGPVYLNKKI
jgi:hypothetical protein